ncbi:flagellar filament capping protein FliD [Desulfovibrio sp.]|uniref:flagellar filament capping protein FliD n=1 Tax=Desulfovibrio sp. TaxID=885 RepID=UPI0035AF21DF
MGNTISGSNAISNLSGSDTDFDTTLAKLKKIESTQLNRLESWKSDWKLRYDAFDKVITQVSTASSVLANLANKNSFVTKNVTSSDSKIVSAVASASADDVQHTINVTQVASNAIWANTGHVFSSKTDVINTSGASQTFSYSYAGKEYSMAVPANTTLDSFVSMVNSSADNPGIKVSIVQASSGYVFQVAGKSTGAANSLVVHSANLVGMTSTGSTSTWKTDNVLDMSSTVTDPTNFAYDLIMEDGNKFSVKIAGNKTNSELAAAINAQVGRSVASIDGSNNLQLTDVKAMYRRDADTQTTFSTPTTKFTVGSSPTTTTLTGDLTVTLNMNDGATTGTRTLTVKAGTTMKDAALQIAQASGATSAEMTYNSSGGWDLSLANVEGATFSFADSGSDSGKISSTVTATATAMGTKVAGSSGTQSFTASTAVTFDSTKLSQALGGTSPDASKSFTYTIVDSSGTTQSFSLTQDKTYQDLLTKLSSYGSASGSTVTLANTESFYLSGGGAGGGMDGLTAKTDAVATIPNMTGGTTLESPPGLVYKYTANGGTQQTISLAGGSKMSDIIAAMKAQGLAGSLVSADGATTIDLQTGTLPTSGSYYLKLDNMDSLSGPSITGQVTASSNWNIRAAANAKYTVDNWPVEMESATNSVSNVIEGVVFTIQDKGSASLSVSTDITSVEKSIQNFLDSVNSVLMTINELSKYDEDKEVTTNDPNKTSSKNYSSSQLTAEKGGLLQGNYGVQLFKSRFTSLLNSAPPGFTSRTTASDVLSGDVLANLANLGIKVETDQSSTNYGLLQIAPSSAISELQKMDQSNYEDMINNHLSDVVDFFCSSGTGASTSADFRYGSHISGITKGGSYDVNYSVDASGNITKVTVGGVEATRDTSQPGYYYSVASGDARGLSLQIDNLTPGDHSGQIRIKEGLVQTVSTFLKGELTFTDVNVTATGTAQQNADAIALKSQNGALMVLKNNYQSIMTNIDKKITQEQTRLDTWEARQKKVFANLETLLKQYNTQKEQLDSQISSLTSSSSS